MLEINFFIVSSLVCIISVSSLLSATFPETIITSFCEVIFARQSGQFVFATKQCVKHSKHNEFWQHFNTVLFSISGLRQIGQDVSGIQDEEEFGFALDLSANGKILVASAILYQNNATSPSTSTTRQDYGSKCLYNNAAICCGFRRCVNER